MKRVTLLVMLSLVSAVVGEACSTNAGNTPPPPPPCDQTCQDAIALRAVREGMKTAYNFLLFGKEVGPQDGTGPCPHGGTVHVFGTATSNAAQGATVVQLTYAFDHCAFLRVDTDPLQNYSVTVNGSITEDGTLSVQPTATTALNIASASLDVSGTVHDPAITYAATACALQLGQNGNQLSGVICGRQAGLSL